jgi:hypothetical protein
VAIFEPVQQYCCRSRIDAFEDQDPDVRTDNDGVYVLLTYGRHCFGGIFFWSRRVVTTDDTIVVVSLFSAVFVLFFLLQFLVVRILNI